MHSQLVNIPNDIIATMWILNIRSHKTSFNGHFVCCTPFSDLEESWEFLGYNWENSSFMIIFIDFRIMRFPILVVPTVCPMPSHRLLTYLIIIQMNAEAQIHQFQFPTLHQYSVKKKLFLVCYLE